MRGWSFSIDVSEGQLDNSVHSTGVWLTPPPPPPHLSFAHKLLFKPQVYCNEFLELVPLFSKSIGNHLAVTPQIVYAPHTYTSETDAVQIRHEGKQSTLHPGPVRCGKTCGMIMTLVPVKSTLLPEQIQNNMYIFTLSHHSSFLLSA